MLMKIRSLLYKEKGQDLVEYAVLLVILFSVAWIIYGQNGIHSSLQAVYSNMASVMTSAANASSDSPAGAGNAS